MTPTAVLDASAAIRLVLPAEGADEFTQALQRAVTVLVPDLFFAEVANALWKYVKAGHLPIDQVLLHGEEAVGLVDLVVPGRELMQEALVTGAKSGCSAYDAFYVVLARRHGATLVTADRALAAVARNLGIDVFFAPA